MSSRDRLWAPWRMEYVADLDTSGPRKSTGCFLCDNALATQGLTRADPRMKQNLVLHQDDRGLILLNKFPYCNGHLLVARPEHIPDLSGYTAAQRAGMMELVTVCERLLKAAYHAQGVNVGINVGRAAGAGVPDHLHIHIVPRWYGDVNFMEVVPGVRVIPQALEKSYDVLAHHLAGLVE